MPLLIQNRRIERPGSTVDLFARYPHLQENARVFRSKPVVDVDPKCLLYIQQREFAATTPADNSVAVLGSDDATTCHLVLVRHTGSGAACLAHCDGSSTWSEVPLIVKAVTSLSKDPAKEGRLELHLVGGFDDESKTSHKLSLNLLSAFQRQKEDIHLETCCITEMNDVLVDGAHRPGVHGIGINIKTGEVFPASFPHKGPAEELRSARTFTGGQMADIYDSNKGVVKIGPCKWSPNLDISFWLSQDDDTILKYLSTSPTAEPPHFVQHIKSTIQFLLEHPSSDSVFPGGQPQHYRRTEQGDWENVNQT
ncbi:protein N-terminal asparagine amidohydrolase-like [Oncorhynchus tshawytscha]|uniref:N-terminal asparagine amidohydrolase n=2 Tax=Salmoninae TaxID=504568 RepID=B5X8G5_SALSA|nr:protein N-terminal asparagine amidohydrolase-like [Oncorhynchus tshawytscha]XP_045547073.1 protein N-terminal asparagine amidohydrolase [Salmo salar]ACI67135.1 N-terminal asparagine amidohydrolase [Salmo salar]|eukprot:XP_013986174.1 PREDICTED: protein N-terminal asparagine amidohydrolase-like [Salmo salar]